MFHPKLAVAVLGVAALTLGPASVILGDFGAPAAHAKGGNGGGNGGGGNGGGKSESSSRSGKSSDNGKSSGARSGSGSKSTQKIKKKSTKSTTSATAQTKAGKTSKARKADVVEASTRPKARDMGKMNGALHANINAVLAHIRNGNLNGPVGLLAGLAIADANAAAAESKAAELQEQAEAHDALAAELERLELESVADYLEAVEAEDLSEEDIAKVSQLIEDTGGLNTEGTDLATTRPTQEEIDAAEGAADDGGTAVTEAEQAILDAWNKEGDEAALLGSLRERLEGHEDAIAEAIASTAEGEEESAEATTTSEVEDPVAAN